MGTATATVRPLPSRSEWGVRRFAPVPYPTQAKPSQRSEPLGTVHCAGQDFLVNKGMVEIFLRHARNILASGGSELTPLLHRDGIELVLISPSTAVACRVNGLPLLDIVGTPIPVLSKVRAAHRQWI